MNVFKASWTGRYEPRGIESEADVILAFAFGRGEDGPGIVNEDLAEFAVKKAREHEIGIIAQLAVADAIEQIMVGEFGGSNLPLVRIDPRSAREGHYMHTGNVLEQAERLIDPGERVMVVAQAFHAPRAYHQTVKAGFTGAILPEGLPPTWDPDSIHQERHCRSVEAWRRREPLVIVYNTLTGRM